MPRFLFALYDALKARRERREAVAALTASGPSQDGPVTAYFCYHCQHSATFYGTDALYSLLCAAYKHHVDRNHDVEVNVRGQEGSLAAAVIHWARVPEVEL